MGVEVEMPGARNGGRSGASSSADLFDRLDRLRQAIAGAAIVVACGLIPGAALETIEPRVDGADDAQPATLVVPQDERIGAAKVMIRTVDGAPLAGAVVRALVVRDGTLLLAGRATSARDGTARIEGLSLGAHWLVADAPGKARASAQRFISGGDVDAEMRLAPERSMHIEVRNEAGRPIDGAELEIHGADPLPRGARTSHGVALPTGLGAGVLRIVARAPGFEDAAVVAQGGALDGATAAPAVVETVETVAIKLQRLGSLTVTVLDSSGRGVADATVAIAGGRLGVARTTPTGPDGVAHIAGLSAGSYDLRAFKGLLVSDVEIGVPLSKGAETTTRMTLAEGRRVAVHVVDEVGAPIAGARVTAIEDGLSPFPQQTTTSTTGDAVVAPLASSSVMVSVRAEGFVGRAALTIEGKFPADPSTPTTIALRRAGTLVGDVRDASGAPIDGATLEVVGTDLDGQPFDVTPATIGFRDALMARSAQASTALLAVGELGVVPGPVPPIPKGRPPGSAAARGLGGASGASGATGEIAPAPQAVIALEPWVSDAAGRFRCTPVPPGKIRAIARHPAYIDGASELVDVDAGGAATVHLVLKSGGRIIGRVRDEAGRPVAGAYLEAVSRTGSLSRGTRSASDGTYVIASVPHEITLDVASAEHPTAVAVRLTVAIPEGGQKEQDVVLPAERASLTVRVVDDRRYPIRGAQVTVASLDPRVPTKSTMFTDDRGDAEIPRVAELAAVLEIGAPGYALHRETFRHVPGRLDVELVQGIVVRGVVLAPGGRIGRRGAVVSLRSSATAGKSREADGGAAAVHAVTGEDGSFRFVDAPRGAAIVTVLASGSAGARKAVQLAPIGSLPEVDLGRIELGAAGVVEGEVVDSLGRAVAGVRVGRGHVARWIAASGYGATACVTTDARGAFTLRDVPIGETEIAAHSADDGDGRSERIRIDEGRVTSHVRIAIQRDATSTTAPAAGAVGVAITILDFENKAIVTVVAPGSEAERAGILEGDELAAVDGVAVSSEATARPRLEGSAGSDAILVVRRDGLERPLRVPREPLLP